MIDAGRPQEYKNNFSMKETFKHIYKTKGIKGFYIVNLYKKNIYF